MKFRVKDIVKVSGLPESHLGHLMEGATEGEFFGVVVSRTPMKKEGGEHICVNWIGAGPRYKYGFFGFHYSFVTTRITIEKIGHCEEIE